MLAMLVLFKRTQQTKKAKCCGRAAILQMYFWRELRRLRPRSPFSGRFLIRNYFFQDSSIFSSTGRVFKSNSPVLTHPMVSGLTQVPRAPLQKKCVQSVRHKARDRGAKYALLFLLCRHIGSPVHTVNGFVADSFVFHSGGRI